MLAYVVAYFVSAISYVSNVFIELDLGNTVAVISSDITVHQTLLWACIIKLITAVIHGFT